MNKIADNILSVEDAKRIVAGYEQLRKQIKAGDSVCQYKEDFIVRDTDQKLGSANLLHKPAVHATDSRTQGKVS